MSHRKKHDSNSCYDLLLSRCRPHHLPAPWCHTMGAEQAVTLPDDMAGLLSQLRSSCTAADLRKAGILAASAAVNLNTCLAYGGRPVVPLRDVSSGAINNLLTEHGCVRGTLKPLFAVVHDQHTLTALSQPVRELLLTDGIEDTIALRSIGLAAAPLVGLAEITQEDCERLAQYFGIGTSPSARQMYEAEELAEYDPETDPEKAVSSGSETGPDVSRAATCCAPADPVDTADPEGPVPGMKDLWSAAEPPELTLVGWSPSTLSRAMPAKVQQLLQLLEQLRKCRRLQIDAFRLWIPSVKSWTAITFAAERNQSQWLADAIRDSMFDDSRRVISQAAPETGPDLATAAAELYEALYEQTEREVSRERRATAIRNYRRAVQRELVGPLYESVQVADPFARTLRLQFAQLTGLFSEKSLLLREKLSRDRLVGSTGGEPTANKLFAELLAVSSQLVTLFRETSRCRSTVSAPRLMPPALARRFDCLDSVTRN